MDRSRYNGRVRNRFQYGYKLVANGGTRRASDDIIISLTEAGTNSLRATTTVNSLNFASTIASGVLDLNDKILTGSSGFTLGGSAYIKPLM